MSGPELPMAGMSRVPSTAVHCTDEVCITCSDAALPVVVLAVRDDGTALVESDGARAEIDVQLIADAAVGDTVLVHAGVAIARVEP